MSDREVVYTLEVIDKQDEPTCEYFQDEQGFDAGVYFFKAYKVLG